MLKDNQELLYAQTAFGTWLEVAAEFGQLDIVRYLIDCGIDVNKSCGVVEGGPINITSFKGDLDVLKLLMENGTVPDVSTAERNPLFAAV